MEQDETLHQSTLLSLSDEVLLNVVDNLDTPGDLASLALSCKRLHRIITPTDPQGLGQLQCRHVSLSIGDAKILSKLATPALAKSVRKLRLRGSAPLAWVAPIEEGYTDIEHLLPRQEDREQFWTFESSNRKFENALVNSVLCHFANLRVLIVDDLSLEPHDRLFCGLESSCPLLEKVYLHTYCNNPAIMEATVTSNEMMEDYFLTTFSGISNISTLDVCVQVPPPWISLKSAKILLNRVPDLILDSRTRLRHLALSIPYLPTSDVFDAVLFPVLCSFNLVLLYQPDNAQLDSWISPFLTRHDMLRFVYLDVMTSWTVEPGALPNLVYLSGFPDDGGSVISTVNSTDTYRPLRWLQMDITELVRVGPLKLTAIPTLIVLDLVCWDNWIFGVLDLTILPNLETLSVSRYSGAVEEEACDLDASPSHIRIFATQFPNLRCLKGFFYGARLYRLFCRDLILDSRGAYTRTLRHVFNRNCPKLQVVDNWRRVEGSSSWDWDTTEESYIVWPAFDAE